MSETRFTHGPWHYDAEAEAIVSDVITCNDNGKDIVCDFDDADANNDEIEANIRLISAAPELYEALHNLVILARPHFSDNVQMLALQLANAALAKARGVSA